ncbi:hypothetical protein BGZ70_004398, partial [Mortierella alpina]
PEPAVISRKPSSSTSRHAYWRKRKEVVIVTPPRPTITSGTISMDGMILASNNPCPARSYIGEWSVAGVQCSMSKNDALSAECHAPMPEAAEPVYRGTSQTFFAINDHEDHDCKVDARPLDHADVAIEAEKSRSIWKDASEILALPRRTTLSSCQSPSTTETGVLYLRLQRACGFSLPIPSERTMISVRIDTGHEKVDTDYVPLDRIDIPFNQEFCLPVTPSLAITITLHLMQAPHLLPRYLAPRSPSPLPLLPLIQPDAPLISKDMLLIDTPSAILDDSTSSRASLFSSVRTTKSLLLPLLFKKRSLQSQSDCSVSTTVSMPSSDSASTATDTACSSESEGQSSPCSAISRSAGQRLGSRPDEVSEFSLSGPPPPHSEFGFSGRGESEIRETQKTRSSFSKWRSGIMSVHKRRKSPTSQQQQQCAGITAEEVEVVQPFQSQYRQQELLQPAAAVDLRPLSTPTDVTLLHTSDFNDYLPPPPAWITSPSSSSSSSSSSSGVPTLPQLTLSEIQESETPLQVLSRHILFGDELCLARSGIMFRDLRRSCENQIVGVEFETINNWVDLNDYSRMSNSNSINSRSATLNGHHLTLGGMRQGALHGHQHKDEDEDDDEVEDDAMDSRCVVAKIMTSMCFVPGPEMDPEDAIYEDEDRFSLEPQNLVECQQGLYYFQWRDQVRFQDRLFYLTARGHWRDAWFCIAGSKLWQCQGPISTEKGPLERIRCLELEDLQQIETNRGIVKMAEPDGGGGPGEGVDEEDEPFYAPRNGFRLRLRVVEEEEDGPVGVERTLQQRRTVTQDFYAESPEMAQAWISTIMGACHDIPPRPYWLR